MTKQIYLQSKKHIFDAWFSLLTTIMAHADRIKDLTSIAGVRSNELIGYGLVVGLNGTGDGGDVPFTGQSLRSLLGRLGVNVDGVIKASPAFTEGAKIHGFAARKFRKIKLHGFVRGPSLCNFRYFLSLQGASGAPGGCKTMLF